MALGEIFTIEFLLWIKDGVLIGSIKHVNYTCIDVASNQIISTEIGYRKVSFFTIFDAIKQEV